MNFLKKIKNHIDTRVENFGHQFVIFGIFGALNYPIYWMVWKFFAIQSYENLTLRLIATCLCIPLIFSKHWPTSLKTWLPLYWYITLIFCLPFFFTFMLLENNAASAWLMSITAIMFWLILLVDSLSFIIILIIGATSAVLLFLCLNGQLPIADYNSIIAQSIGTLLVGVFFAHNKANVETNRLQTMKSLSAIMAHELRTPLAAIAIAVDAAKKYFPSLVDAHKIAQENKLSVEPINEKVYDLLLKVFNNCASEVRYSNTVIDMILMNAKEKIIGKKDFQPCNIQVCVEEALERYPFKSDYKDLVRYHSDGAFDFKGNQPLMVHILFNLLKNALYFIEAERKGSVTIWLQQQQKYNVLYFKDTAKGITPEVLSKLFKRFYTTTRHGTGLGLAYSKMVMEAFGGEILCTSELGKYTQFELRFPKIKQPLRRNHNGKD